ncbi:unnamed protein product, partial [Musa acuminata var. zebrina]
TFRFPKKKSLQCGNCLQVSAEDKEEEFYIPEANSKTGNEWRRFAELSNDWEEGKQISMLNFVVGVTLTNSAYLTFYYGG